MPTSVDSQGADGQDSLDYDQSGMPNVKVIEQGAGQLAKAFYLKVSLAVLADQSRLPLMLLCGFASLRDDQIHCQIQTLQALEQKCAVD